MEVGNKMQNHKIETNSELIYEDDSNWSTLIFIKIIGSDTLWFPLPPSEVLFKQQYQTVDVRTCRDSFVVYATDWGVSVGDKNILIFPDP